MRITITCVKCFQEQISNDPENLLIRGFPAELTDSGLYRMTCIKGHESIICLQQQKFEVLFDLALNAIIDGYNREAVSSFTACLERFYEFYIHVLCIKHNIDRNKFNEAWKTCAAQSERQLGAFVFLYLIENKEQPQILSRQYATFRNDVIHKGRIPSRQEAIDFGKYVLSIIEPVLSKLKKEESEHVHNVVLMHIIETKKKIKGDSQISFMSIPTTISIDRGVTEPQPTLVEALTQLELKRQE